MIPQSARDAITAAPKGLMPDKSHKDSRISNIENAVSNIVTGTRSLKNCGIKPAHAIGSNNDAVAAYKNTTARPARSKKEVNFSEEFIRYIYKILIPRKFREISIIT